ncbi:MAG: hypothetical protein HN778_17110, partial [Prolixibacteraceae bacterium]|nr:hypothetical protein [Prolixibacteraceae bacterium]
MKGFYLKIATLILMLCSIAFGAIAQRSNGITIEGKINVQEGSVSGAVIQMFQDGRRLDNYGVGADGRYKVELNYNHKFELIFTLNGNFSQKIAIVTEVRPNVLWANPIFPPVPIDINLFTEIQGIDKSFSENTVLKIYYNDNVDNFISEVYYNDAQIKSLIDQAILQSQIIEKEADHLSKLTRAELAELRKEYDKLLEEAGEEYSNEEFLAALDGYKAANKIFPDEQFPKDRIAEINDLLGLMLVAGEMETALLERFNTLIINADLLFDQEKYFDARNLYNRALSIDPNNDHARQRIIIINDLLNKQQTELQYQDLIVQADNAFNEILYEAALQIYVEASQLKPEENYPKSKIDEINNLLSQQAKNTENQESYKQAIFQAELNFEKQFYDKSIASYENALVYKPGDPLAEQKIIEIKDLMKAFADKSLFDRLIKAADKSYNRKLYAEALVDYEKSLELLPDEIHPKERIDLINQIFNAEATFLESIKQADQAFTEQKYLESKNLYTQALEIQSNDKHALDRIKEIEGIFDLQGIDQQYNNLIAQADQLFSENNYEIAKNSYNDALAIKSKEQYPKDKIAEINSILQSIAKTNQEYQRAIEKADGLYQREEYSEAKPVYLEASRIKPTETYPPEMINKIDAFIQDQARILAEQQANEEARLAAMGIEKDRNYQQTIDEADRLINENELVAAIGKFRDALDIKPQEQYPIMRIEEIRGMISSQQDAQKAYEEAVANGDREFRRESFDLAKTAYNEATLAKPAETYPGKMIAKIDSITDTRARLAAEAEQAERERLAALEAEKERLYNEAITNADNLFGQNEYENARSEYRAALNVKPDEAYPQQKIDEIATLLAQLSAAQKAYEEAVANGDREFRRESFDLAKTAYNEATLA